MARFLGTAVSLMTQTLTRSKQGRQDSPFAGSPFVGRLGDAVDTAPRPHQRDGESIEPDAFEALGCLGDRTRILLLPVCSWLACSVSETPSTRVHARSHAQCPHEGAKASSKRVKRRVGCV